MQMGIHEREFELTSKLRIGFLGDLGGYEPRLCQLLTEP
jgi:hypothetical protein